MKKDDSANRFPDFSTQEDQAPTKSSVIIKTKGTDNGKKKLFEPIQF